MMQRATKHEHHVRVYAEDVDFMGIVFHAHYLCYFERARTEMLRHHNVLLSELIKNNILFAVHEISIKYLLPAKLDDALTITTYIEASRGCSIDFKQSMSNAAGDLLCEASIRVVCVDSQLKPKRLPKLEMTSE